MLNHEAGKHGDQCCGLCPEHIQMERDDLFVRLAESQAREAAIAIVLRKLIDETAFWEAKGWLIGETEAAIEAAAGALANVSPAAKALLEQAKRGEWVVALEALLLQAERIVNHAPPGGVPEQERDDWLKAWNKHCAQAEKEVQDAYGRD